MATATTAAGQSDRTGIILAIAHALLIAAAAAALPAVAGAQTGQSNAVYVARLSALNTTVTGLKSAGEATLTIKGDSLTIAMNASGLPKNIEHWQHFHGFTDGREATCPTQSADANGDGIIDVVETGAAAGTTMVPFSGDPVSMDVAHGAYPKATATGALQYRETVSLSALQAAFAKAFDGQKLDLDRRVVFIHGIPAASTLKSSVASLGPIPGQVTLPIACGKLTLTK
jgi:Cu/Zn superoxide dismutase